MGDGEYNEQFNVSCPRHSDLIHMSWSLASSFYLNLLTGLKSATVET